MADLTTLTTLTTTISSPIATTTPPPAAAAMALLRRDDGDNALTLTSCSYQAPDPSSSPGGIPAAPACVCDGGATTLPPLSITSSVTGGGGDDQSCQYTSTVAAAAAPCTTCEVVRQVATPGTTVPASVLTSTGDLPAAVWQRGYERGLPTESVESFLSTHAIYLHRVTLTWFKDLNVPEQFGFQHNQAIPFRIPTEDHVSLHAWHVLPLGVYRRNYEELLHQKALGAIGEDADYTSTLNFRLLRDDPEARLIIYMHGTSGTMASGYRPDSYRALYAGAPDKIHILTFDYRGFGLSTGDPSEAGLLVDAVSVFDWATKVAGIPPERIVIFGQSLGSAVAIALANNLAAQVPSVSCAGLVVTSSFSDLASLTATYRIGGLVPVLSPVAKFPRLFHYFCRHLTSTWLNKDRIAELVRTSDWYHITLLHAEDDSDIRAEHTESLYWHAVNATSDSDLSFEAFEEEKEKKKTRLGEGGWFVEWRTEKGLIRQDMAKYGVHDKIMSHPIVSMAVLRVFQSVDPQFEA
ncbi:hypothetical protein VMCG_07750 [Cytospora schulzeri]|uniref:AB hydrolase-1 domain-containing protein n=1 Tax=Cytospora schulzeri TaxID=448051 RepID=A0A423VZL5_9PEZI|nr:hypothetical protein VMCG_07750 [Valsa malicola]